MVSLYDQGRRGPGGRASHRSVLADGAHDDPDPSSSSSRRALTDDDAPREDASSSTYEFDHGCQFFRADAEAMRGLVREWTQKGWVAPWKARLGGDNNSSSSSSSSSSSGGFFGIPARPEPVYIAVGGMHQLPCKILSDCYSHSKNLSVHRGTRVCGVERAANGRSWQLKGVAGEAAYHDTEAGESSDTITDLGAVDAVLFTDRSSAFDSWHKASAGIPPAFRERLLAHCSGRARVPLFSCMVALSHPIRSSLLWDAFTVSAVETEEGNNPLWFAACSQAKPGFPMGAAECWTLISTPRYAVEQIQETTMQDPVTGSFRPQKDDYLNTVPGPALWNAFCDTVRPSLAQSGTKLPEAVYLQAQRWGSGLPAPPTVAPEDVVQVCGVDYAKRVPDLVYERPPTTEPDFVAHDDMALFAAGDFTSHRCPGFEAAALSGLDVAQHMAKSLVTER